jgi:hypothetical protein
VPSNPHSSGANVIILGELFAQGVATKEVLGMLKAPLAETILKRYDDGMKLMVNVSQDFRQFHILSFPSIA